MNMEHVVKIRGAIHHIETANQSNLEINFYGRPATYWHKQAVVITKSVVDGKFIKLEAKA